MRLVSFSCHHSFRFSIGRSFEISKHAHKKGIDQRARKRESANKSFRFSLFNLGVRGRGEVYWVEVRAIRVRG